MANIDLLQQIKSVAVRFRAHEINEDHLFSSLEANVNGLEGIDNDLWRDIRESFAGLALLASEDTNEKARHKAVVDMVDQLVERLSIAFG